MTLCIFWPVINKKYADIYIPWPLIFNMVILPIVFVFILPQVMFGLKVCDHGTKTDEKCPIYLEKETTCTCKEVTKPKKQYQLKYFHQHEKENSNWLKISCKGIGSIQMLRVSEKLSSQKIVIKYFNIKKGNLSVIEDDMFLDLKIAHLNIYDSSK